jgi:hypothetical protein
MIYHSVPGHHEEMRAIEPVSARTGEARPDHQPTRPGDARIGAGTFRQFLTDRHGSTDDTLLDPGARPPRSYRDVLARSERKRPDGAPVWPLTDADFSSRRAA